MKKEFIENLTPEQDAKLEEYYEKWLAIGMQARPTTDDDRKISEESIKESYKNEGLKEPKIIWCKSPIAGALKARELDDKESNIQYNVCYGSQDADWLGFYEFFMNELDMKEECKDLIPLINLAKHCGWVYTYENVAIMTELPIEVHVNENGDLHNFNGPALKYSDNECLYYFNGVKVTKELAERPIDIFTKDTIIKETNADIRREIIRKLGMEKVSQLLDYKIIDVMFGELYIENKYWRKVCNFFGKNKLSNSLYELISFDVGDKKERPYLKMVNPSIGTIHIEGVTTDCDTAEKAICYRNGLKEFSLPKTLDGQEYGNGTYHQQGDALFFPIDSIPKDAKLKDNMVAVEGLRRHIAKGKNVKVYEGYLDASEGCIIVHPEHSAKRDTYLKGLFQVKQVVEFDHFLEESRIVID